MSLWRRLWTQNRSPSREVDAHTGYECWANCYASERNPVLSLETQALKELLPDVGGKRVLDVGCGTGRVSQQLAQLDARCVIGVDFSVNMLRSAMAQLRSCSSVTLVAGGAIALPFANETFDIVTCSLMTGHLEKLEPAVKELARVARLGSSLLISDFHPYAHLLGWKRSFRHPHNGSGEELHIRNYLHLHEDYFRAFRESGLQADEVSEPCIDESVRHFYQHSREASEIYERFVGHPLVLMFRLTRR